MKDYDTITKNKRAFITRLNSIYFLIKRFYGVNMFFHDLTVTKKLSMITKRNLYLLVYSRKIMLLSSNKCRLVK